MDDWGGPHIFRKYHMLTVRAVRWYPSKWKKQQLSMLRNHVIVDLGSEWHGIVKYLPFKFSMDGGMAQTIQVIIQSGSPDIPSDFTAIWRWNMLAPSRISLRENHLQVKHRNAMCFYYNVVNTC